MKYVIEFDRSVGTGDGTRYFAKGFNTLCFDDNGLSKLEPLADYMHRYYNYARLQEACDKARQEGYEEGLKKVWECARKIAEMDTFEQTAVFEINNCYPSRQISDIFNGYSANVAIEILEKWENKKDTLEAETLNECKEQFQKLVEVIGDEIDRLEKKRVNEPPFTQSYWGGKIAAFKQVLELMGVEKID